MGSVNSAETPYLEFGVKLYESLHIIVIAYSLTQAEVCGYYFVQLGGWGKGDDSRPFGY
jgi:hypothetical protein